MSAPTVIEPVKPTPAIVERVEPAKSAIVGMLKSLDSTAPPEGSGESGLPQSHHDAYRLKLQGISPDAIGAKFGVSRVTIWRWCNAVAEEFRESIERTPVLNQIGEALARLDDLSKANREAAANAKAGREKALFLSESRRCEKDKTNLLIAVGVLPKQPEKLFQITADLRPADLENPNDNPSGRTREELLAELLRRLETSRTIT